MAKHNIIVPKWHNKEQAEAEIAAQVAAEKGFMPLRILCPGCNRIYTLYVESPEQGLHTLLGQACSYCKRFITEKDDPEKLLADLKEIRNLVSEDNKKKGKV